jgi:hypothetical protein
MALNGASFYSLARVDFRTELVAAKSLSVKRLCAALGRKIIERRQSLVLKLGAC